VLEKEKGMLEYLMMNGMSQTAYNLSFILHEMLINGPIIVGILDGIIWYRVDPEFVKWNELFLFNFSIILFIGGVVCVALLISKGFNSPGFAIQIGSILYILPVFLSLYLKVLEMKHNVSAYANDKFGDDIMDFGFGEEVSPKLNNRNKMKLNDSSYQMSPPYVNPTTT
jgi:hypothetical protein